MKLKTALKLAGNKAGGKIARKYVPKSMRKALTNPFVIATAAAYATSAVKQYNRNKRLTAKLYSPDSQKETYKKIIADLMRTGKYRRVREKRVSGGVEWELDRR